MFGRLICAAAHQQRMNEIWWQQPQFAIKTVFSARLQHYFSFCNVSCVSWTNDVPPMEHNMVCNNINGDRCAVHTSYSITHPSPFPCACFLSKRNEIKSCSILNCIAFCTTYDALAHLWNGSCKLMMMNQVIFFRFLKCIITRRSRTNSLLTTHYSLCMTCMNELDRQNNTITSFDRIISLCVRAPAARKWSWKCNYTYYYYYCETTEIRANATWNQNAMRCGDSTSSREMFSWMNLSSSRTQRPNAIQTDCEHISLYPIQRHRIRFQNIV